MFVYNNIVVKKLIYGGLPSLVQNMNVYVFARFIFAIKRLFLE